MIYQNENTPYAQAMAKKEASDSVGALMNSDAFKNDLFIDYIIMATEAQTVLRTVDIICRDYSTAAETKVRIVKELTKKYAEDDNV